jgi:hypothetical protein
MGCSCQKLQAFRHQVGENACKSAGACHNASIEMGVPALDEKPTGRAKGGIARAKKLSPEDRALIAKRAAEARWGGDENAVLATHTGTLRIGDLEIECAVLKDGRRVLSQRGVNRALGRVHGGAEFRKKAEGGGGQLPVFLVAKGLQSHISKDLEAVVKEPILYRTRSRAIAHGIDATVLPQVCDVWTGAEAAGDLRPNQLRTAERARILIRGLAHVGIVGLVDEATGYQDERSRTALQDIFNTFLRKELAAWVQRFPDEFYREIFRLRGWNWTGMKGGRRPQALAYYTVDLVYSRLLPGIMEELESRMPRTESGRRKGKLHQLFSDDVGHPALSQHLYAVITLMRVADDGDWDGFMRMVDRAHPKKTDKWLKALLQGSIEATREEAAAATSIESLPLFERLKADPVA